MSDWFFGVIREQILFGHISDVFCFVVFGIQVIKRLVFVRSHAFRNGVVPLLSISKFRVDIENYPAKRVDPVLYNLSDAKFGVAYHMEAMVVDGLYFSKLRA